jgi:hypothetical protein
MRSWSVFRVLLWLSPQPRPSTVEETMRLTRTVWPLATGVVLSAAAFVAPTAATAASPGEGATARAGCCDIVVTDQARDQILVLDAAKDWEGGPTSQVVKWAWRPTLEEGFDGLIDNWGLPDEAKLRHFRGQRYLLTTDSFGLAAMVPYPSGDGSYWAADVGRPANPHSMEILPDGNVAVAASTGAWVRVYTASQGPRSTTYTQFDLAGAHAVVWDADRELLWTVGDEEVVGLTVGGTSAAPTLTATKRYPLPTPGGHDLQPVPDDDNRLWVSSGSRVYQLDVRTGEFHSDYRGAETVDVDGVKAVTTNPATGQVLTTRPEEGTGCTWCTATVRMHLPTDSRTLPDSQIYKARWWVDPNTD